MKWARCKRCKGIISRDDMLAMNIKMYDSSNNSSVVRVRLCPKCWEYWKDIVIALEWDNNLFSDKDALLKMRHPIGNLSGLLFYLKLSKEQVMSRCKNVGVKIENIGKYLLLDFDGSKVEIEFPIEFDDAVNLLKSNNVIGHVFGVLGDG